MATPFITFVEPGKLDGYQRGRPHESQPASIPQGFLDAMEVRENVFVHEQGVLLANEFDEDDPRSCHWVMYASVNKTDEVEVRDDDGNVVQPRKSSTRSTPIGTIRLVPFPQEPHPVIGGNYEKGLLDGNIENATQPSYNRDRPTTMHDGKEPYVKLGRLAVIKEFRGNKIANQLVSAALNWLQANPSFFDPSLTEMGLEQMGAADETDIPKWAGLVCCHAQKQVANWWGKQLFVVDEAMGTWREEGIEHVGMFKRLKVGSK